MNTQSDSRPSKNENLHEIKTKRVIWEASNKWETKLHHLEKYIS